MAAPQQGWETVSGTVRSSNEKGLLLEGHEGWYDWSRFVPFASYPARGDVVTLTVARGKYIQAWRTSSGGGPGAEGTEGIGVDASTPPPTPVEDDPATWGFPRGTATPRPVGPAPIPTPSTGMQPQALPRPAPAGRERLRAAAALAAATFLAGRADLSTEDCLDTASVLLAWIITGEEA
jgi:hypothetical protein